MSFPKDEDVRKAYDEGCPDFKKTLKTLFPNIFKDPISFPYIGKSKDSGGLYLVLDPHDALCIKEGRHSSPFGKRWMSISIDLTEIINPIKGIQEEI